MDTSKHTPGPWEVRVTNGRDAPAFHVAAPVLRAGGREDSIMRGDFCRSEADAALIAAAPELLAALRLAQDILAGHAPHTVGDEHQIAAALAKAGAA